MSLSLPFPGFAFHPHQVEAIAWMQSRERDGADHFRGGILADEMGLGKTWMTIGLLLNNPVANTMLLSPPALQGQWSEALQRACIAHRVMIPISKAVAEEPRCWREVPGARADVYVSLATYDRATYHRKLLDDRVYDRLVCDEGHVFRNGPSTRRFRELSTITAPRRWILSGTPIQNSKTDIRNLFRFLGIQDTYYDTKKVADATMLRRVVSEVRATVPSMPIAPPTHIIHPVTLPAGGEEERVFSSLVGRFEHAVEVHAKASIILELYLRIRQFIAHPAIYVNAMRKKFGDVYGRTTWAGTTSKLGAFQHLLRNLPKMPTIVFGTFRSELEHAELAMRAAGYETWMIRGGISDSARENAIRESREAAAAGRPISIIIQIVSGGTGLNLQHCNRIVFLSSHWNPAMVDQAIARAYRMGQSAPVTVHHLLLADDAERNLDRYMAAKHAAKRIEALSINDKLYSDSAVCTEVLMGELDDALDDEDEFETAVIIADGEL